MSEQTAQSIIDALVNAAAYDASTNISLVSNPLIFIHIPAIQIDDKSSRFVYSFYVSDERVNDDARTYKKKWNKDAGEYEYDETNVVLARQNDLIFEGKVAFFSKFFAGMDFAPYNNKTTNFKDFKIQSINDFKIDNYIIKMLSDKTFSSDSINDYLFGVSTQDLLEQMFVSGEITEDDREKYSNSILQDEDSDFPKIQRAVNVMVLSHQIRYISFMNALLSNINASTGAETSVDFVTTFMGKFFSSEYAIQSKAVPIDNNWIVSSDLDLSQFGGVTPMAGKITELPYGFGTGAEIVDSVLAASGQYGDTMIYYIANLVRRTEQPKSTGDVVECIFGDVDGLASPPETKIGGGLSSANDVKTIKHKGFYTDWKIMYDRDYYYTVSPLFELHQKYIDEKDGLNKVVKFFVEGPLSKPIKLSAVESIAPLPPRDFSVVLRDNDAILTWSNPLNSQKDIKKFNIYKRASISDSFSLLLQYDFRDWKGGYGIESNGFNQYGTTQGIRVPQSFVQLKDPMFSFVDENYVLGNIYTVTCVDAHELESNYSSQLQIGKSDSYEFGARKYVIRRLSQDGAPLQYPNWFLDISDKLYRQISFSGVDNIQVQFVPNILEVKGTNNKLRINQTKDVGNRYTLNLVNTDIMEEKNIELRVKSNK